MGLSLFSFGTDTPAVRPAGKSKEDRVYADLPNPNNNGGFIPFVMETPVEVLKHWD